MTQFQESIEPKKAIPNCKGLNHQNLRCAEKFYTLYKDNFPQIVGELVLIPWGHHRIIIDKCETIEKCLFYIPKQKVITIMVAGLNLLKQKKKGLITMHQS